MSSPDHIKKYVVLALVFAVWLIGDLWTKHWADVTLADPQHPIPVTVTAAEAGKPVADVVAARLGAERHEVQGYIVKLPEHVALQAETKLYDRSAGGDGARGYYVFWRPDGTLPPRRLNKTDSVLLNRWVRAGAPKADPAAVREAVTTHVHDIQLGDWLQSHVRRIGDDRVAEVAGERMHPIQGSLSAVNPDAPAQEGVTYLVEWHRIDVIGDWFKLIYAENPGAAFGFMGSLPPSVRDTVFFVLTIIVFLVILGIVVRTSPGHWVVLVALTGVLAGAVGNFIDRIRYGYVIDFIDMHLGFMRWPTYNVADVAISIGVVLLLLDVMFNKDSALT